MKKIFGIAALLLALCVMFTGCTRNYSEWSPIYCDSIDESEDAAGIADADRTAFYVPDEWIVSRIDDFFFFSNYNIKTLDDLNAPGGQIYLVGWIAHTEEEAQVYDVTHMFDYVSIPSDSAMFSASLKNGAVLGREKYFVANELQQKYYITLKSNEFYEIKLVDWQDLCGKELLRKIGGSFKIREIPKVKQVKE